MLVQSIYMHYRQGDTIHDIWDIIFIKENRLLEGEYDRPIYSYDKLISLFLMSPI